MNPPDRESRDLGAIVGLVVWVAVIAVAVVWPLVDPLPEGSSVNAPPFYGRWGVHDLTGLIPALVLSVMLVWCWPVLVTRLGRVALPATTGAASTAWAIALALSGGWDRLWSPLTSVHGYLEVGREYATSTFTHTFVRRLDQYPIHVKGHPPGAVLVYRWFDELGFSGPAWAAVLTLAIWALGIAAVMFAVEAIGDLDVARRASAAVAFAPAAVWVATTADALFAGVTAIGVSAIVVATTRSGRIRDALAVAGGAVATMSLYLTYGAAPLALIPIAVLVSRRATRVAFGAVLGGGAVVAAWTIGGFWWLGGLNATRSHYGEGIAALRPYAYFVLAGNLAALAVAIGPAAAAGLGSVLRSRLASVRDRDAPIRPSGAEILAIASFVAVVIADASGLSKAEVERIWIPFVPWIAVAAAAVWTSRSSRQWLAATLGLGLVVQATLVTPW